jgi:hypothetical protein
MKNECAYCDDERETPWHNYRNNMCPDCKEGYDSHLEDKADAERDERLIRKLEGKGD